MPCEGQAVYLNSLDATMQDPADANLKQHLAAMATNFSTKPAFERDGNLIEIPDNKLESIPAEIAKYGKTTICY